MIALPGVSWRMAKHLHSLGTVDQLIDHLILQVRIPDAQFLSSLSDLDLCWHIETKILTFAAIDICWKSARDHFMSCSCRLDINIRTLGDSQRRARVSETVEASWHSSTPSMRILTSSKHTNSDSSRVVRSDSSFTHAGVSTCPERSNFACTMARHSSLCRANCPMKQDRIPVRSRDRSF
jgi:hypothetical protein